MAYAEMSQILKQVPEQQKNYHMWIMLSSMIARHPLPWREEQDWSSEIYDSQGALVIKFSDSQTSKDFISLVNDFYLEQEHESKELFKELGIEDPFKNQKQ